MTDFAEEDLIRFWQITMDEDVVKGINDGAKLLKQSNSCLVRITAKQWGRKPNPKPELRQFGWTW